MTTTTIPATADDNAAAVERMTPDELLKGLEDLAPPEEQQTDTTATLRDFRIRAKALGYRTIRKRGDTYSLINVEGESEAGATSLDTMGRLLNQFEDTHATLEAGGVVVYSTACGIPQSAHDRDGDIPLDDPRVVALLREAV
jgi:hypothetical protein